MNNSSSSMGSWDYQEGDSTVQEWLQSSSSDGSTFNDDSSHHSGSLVFSKAMEEPGIAEEWDDAWESLYTMDDDTIYTTLTKTSNKQPMVVFEDMPAPKKESKKKRTKQKQANIENLSNAMQHLSQCAKAQGMSKEELMELMEMLMAQQTDEKGKKALAAAKKVLIRSDDFLSDNNTKGDTITTKGEEQGHRVEVEGVITRQDKLPACGINTVDVDDLMPTAVADDNVEVSLEEQSQDEEEEYYDAEEEIPDEHSIPEEEDDEEEGGLSVLEEGSAEEDESSEEVNQEIALPALESGTDRMPTVGESGPRLPWMNWMNKRATKTSSSADSKPEEPAQQQQQHSKAMAPQAPPTDPVRATHQEPPTKPTVAKPSADSPHQKERKRRWFQFWLLHRKPKVPKGQVLKHQEPKQPAPQPPSKPAKRSLQSRLFASRSRNTAATSNTASSARRSKHAPPTTASHLGSRPLSSTSEHTLHTACMDDSISSAHTFASMNGTVTSNVGVAPDVVGVKRQLSAIHESPTMAEC